MGTVAGLWALSPVFSKKDNETLPLEYSSSGENKHAFKAELEHCSVVSNSSLEDKF